MAPLTAAQMDPIMKARAILTVDEPWFGSLALRLRLNATETIPTVCVDGVTLSYNQEFIASLTKPEQLFVVAHEVMHCALLHMTRRGHREPMLWNIAADYVINLALKDSGFTLPKDVLIAERFRDMHAEQVYAIMEKEHSGSAGQKLRQAIEAAIASFADYGHVSDAPSGDEDGDGKWKKAGKSCVDGKDDDGAGPGRTPADIETEWKVAVQEATMVAQKAGELPRGVKRLTDKLLESRTDWRNVFRPYISVVGDYSYLRPNRRQIPNGLYLPGAIKTKLNCLVFAIDMSGSISGKMLQIVAGEAEAVFASEERPDCIYVVYCDAAVQRVDEITEELRFNAVGGGGTKFQPVFDWVEKEGLEPEALIYFTDLDCFDKPRDPGYPVLWLVPECHVKDTMTFGEVLVVPEED